MNWAKGGAVVLFAATQLAASQPQVRGMKKDSGGFLGGKWYGSVEFRHHLNTYYEKDGYLSGQEPTGHARLQVGSRFYQKTIDAYLTLGLFKRPSTLKVSQRRPELAVDFYPVRNLFVTVLQYNLVRFPVGSPSEAEDHLKEDRADGTVYLAGAAPTLRYPWMIQGHRIAVKTGLDVWTKLYSRRQYTEDFDREPVKEEPRFALEDGERKQKIEDYAPHFDGDAMAGFAWVPAFATDFGTEATVHYRNRFRPHYTVSGTETDYRYKAERFSYYRLRGEYHLTKRVSVVNDFYHFHDGLFTAKRKGEDNRRFRNIARIMCEL